jgi:ubiquinone/menaquinone biosynthesis C-methylase UbiE
MDSNDIKNLIKDGLTPGTWADLGSGQGNFTLALRELAGPDIEIYSVDYDAKSLKIQESKFHEKFPDTKIHFIAENFLTELNLPQLDGILMANSLHFIKYKDSFLDQIKNHLKPNGRLLIVEYDTDSPNPYVPHPLSFGNLDRLLNQKGFTVQLLGQAPSHYQGSMYSALATLK